MFGVGFFFFFILIKLVTNVDVWVFKQEECWFYKGSIELLFS